MEKQEFVLGLETVKAFYLDWDFSFSKMQVDVWYEYFKKYDLDKFKEIIECYITHRSSGPNSPKQLMYEYRLRHLEEFSDDPMNAASNDLFKRAGV